MAKAKKGVPKHDGTGQGIRKNADRGGCGKTKPTIGKQPQAGKGGRQKQVKPK